MILFVRNMEVRIPAKIITEKFRHKVVKVFRKERLTQRILPFEIRDRLHKTSLIKLIVKNKINMLFKKNSNEFPKKEGSTNIKREQCNVKYVIIYIKQK